MADRLSLKLGPDELRELVEPLIPVFESRPQGGGTAPLDARAVFTSIVYVLTSGCARRDLPPSCGVPFQTAHRRFSKWTKGGLWRRLHYAILDELGSQGLLNWKPRDRGRRLRMGEKRGSMTGPSPVDRGKSGSKIHALSNRAGLPLAVVISAALILGASLTCHKKLRKLTT